MVRDAFISYSKKDKAIADAVCKALENDGLSCWYAPRDVEIGADWDASIMDALANCRVMILIWSTNSDTSRQVKREIAIALDDIGVSLIPFRTEVIEPSKLRYYLGNIQWLDASTPPLEDSLRLLIQEVRTTIARIDHSPGSLREQIPPSAAEKTEIEERPLEEQRKADEAERERAEAEARKLAEAETHRAEMEAQQRAEEQARERAAEEARIRAAAEAERLLLEKQAAEQERQRLAEEQAKAKELERQRVETEARQRQEAEARERRELEARQRLEAEAEQKRKEAEALEAVRHAEAQAALNEAELQRKLRESEAPFGGVPPSISRVPDRPHSSLETKAGTVAPAAFSSFDSYDSTPNDRFPLRLVAIAGAALLIVVAAVAYGLWPTKADEQNQPSTEAVASNQTPTPEVPSPLPSAESTSERSSTKPSPTPRKVPTPGKSSSETTDPPSAKPTPPRAPISGGVLNGKAISLPRPAYPPIARQAHASGTVVVQVTIDENGNVISAHAVSGHPLLQSAAVAAARGARFGPTKLAGQPVKVTGVITYNFVAQ